MSRTQTDTIEIEIEIAARPSTVYKFLSIAERFCEWLGEVTAAPTAGGEISIRYPNGDVMRGEFVELVPDRRISFTWGYEKSANGMAPGSTNVTIDLEGISSGTRLRLRHAGIPNDAARAGHLTGWNYYATQLTAAVAKRAFADALPAALDAYTRAFNEPEETRRMAALAECWNEDATFVDSMGRGTGRAELSRYIGMAHQMAPGFRIEFAKPRQTADNVLLDWSIFIGAHLYGTGNTFARLSPNGTFSSTIGFANPPNE